jgi:hypothetical protein
VNREAEPAENQGEQEDEQDDTHELISFFLYGRRPNGTRVPRYRRSTPAKPVRISADVRASPADYGFRPLAASLTFSPACFTSAVVWSALPSASSRSLPTAFPAVSLALPLVSWTLFFALSEVLTTVPFLVGLC